MMNMRFFTFLFIAYFYQLSANPTLINDLHEFLLINQRQVYIPHQEEISLLENRKPAPPTIAKYSALLGLELGMDTHQVVLVPRQTTSLSAEVNYPVKRIWKKLGDRFRRGELLIQLENTVPKGNHDKALAQLEQANAKLEATSQLFNENLSSLFELKETEAEVAKAKAELALAEKQLTATQIIAPYNGVVESLNIEEHELPHNGKELLKIIDDEALVARLLVPSKHLFSLTIGMPFTIHLSDTNQEIEAKITRIGGMIDPASSMIKIEAEIDNHKKILKAGMSGLATFNHHEDKP